MEAYFDELLSALGEDEDRRVLITSLRQKPAAERSRWISPLDALFEPEPESIVEDGEPDEPDAGVLGQLLRGSELSALPPLSSINVALDTLREGEDLVEDAFFEPDQFLRSQDSRQRAQVAATLYSQAHADWRERIHWLGSYAFAKAEQVAGADANHFLVTFLLCSYYCNTDIPVRDVALRFYIKNAGSRADCRGCDDRCASFYQGASSRVGDMGCSPCNSFV